jgi:MFS family permease
LQRFIRFFAFGGSTIVLALYLHAIHMPDAQIGLFMSLTLVGDVISFGLALLADGVGRKIILGGGALLMVMSGVVFAVTGNFWFLLAAGVFGVISPKYVPFHPIFGSSVLMVSNQSGREIGPFSAIEESTLAHLTKPEIRSDIFAWYVVIGSTGSASGKLLTGWVVQELQMGRGWNSVSSYRAVFLAYAGLGFLNLLLTLVLSSRVELHWTEGQTVVGDSSVEEEPLISSEMDSTNEMTVLKEKRTLLPRISKESRVVLLKLCMLFAVDSLASGLVPA